MTFVSLPVDGCQVYCQLRMGRTTELVRPEEEPVRAEEEHANVSPS